MPSTKELNTIRVPSISIAILFTLLSAPSANCSTQCNLGLKLFSIESGNAICAPIADFHCIELCEWVDADKGGCSLSSHYTAFRGRRTFLTGLVFTEGSFLVQCCASLASSILLDAELDPICRWSEQIETVIDKPSMRFAKPLGENEYFRDLRGIRHGRGAAKMQAEICRYVVQRTNCDRDKMSPEDAHEYSLLLLRLQRTRVFFNSTKPNLNTGSSSPAAAELPSSSLTAAAGNERERARAEHRIIYKNNSQVEQLGFIERDGQKYSAPRNPLETVSKFLESAIVENGAAIVADDGRFVVDGMSNNNSGGRGAKNSENLTISGGSTSPAAALKGEGEFAPPPKGPPLLYNGPRHYNVLWTRHHQQQPQQQQQQQLGGQLQQQLGGQPTFVGGAEKARTLRELFYRAAKQGSALLRKLSDQKGTNGSVMARPSLPIRRLRPFPSGEASSKEALRARDDNASTIKGKGEAEAIENGQRQPIRMQMSRLGWPKGMRRRLWPVLATNTTRELLPTTTNFNWVDNSDFFPVSGSQIRNGNAGTTNAVVDRNVPEPIRWDRIRPQPPSPNYSAQSLRIRKLRRKSMAINNGRREESLEEMERRKEAFAEKGFASTSSGGGGSFASTEEPINGRATFFPPIKEVNTSPLERAPEFKVVPFLEKKPSPTTGNLNLSRKKTTRDGQVRMPAGRVGSEQLESLLECCQQQAPGCRTLCTRDVSKEQIKLAMASGQCPPLSMTSVLQCFPRFYNVSLVAQCCAGSPILQQQQGIEQPRPSLPTQCLSLCAADFHLSFAHLACIEHSEVILSCYRQLLAQTERHGFGTIGTPPTPFAGERSGQEDEGEANEKNEEENLEELTKAIEDGDWQPPPFVMA